MESDLNFLRSIISDNNIRINKMNISKGVSFRLGNTKTIDKKGSGSTFTQDSMWEVSFCVLPYVCHEFVLGKGKTYNDYLVVCSADEYTEISRYMRMTSLYQDMFSSINDIIESDLRVMKDFIRYVKTLIGGDLVVEYSSVNSIRSNLMIESQHYRSYDILSLVSHLSDEITNRLNELLLPWSIIFTHTRMDNLNEITTSTRVVYRSSVSDLLIMNRE